MSYPRADLGGLSPPDGIVPDFDHPDTDVFKYNIACQTLCFTLVGACVGGRCYAKFFLADGFKIEDYSCLIAWALVTAMSALALACNPLHGGSHQWDVRLSNLTSLGQIYYFSELLYYAAAFFAKTSILCLIARVFAPHRRIVFATRITIGLMVLFYIPAFFIKVFRCNPIHKIWDITTPRHCIATERQIFTASNVISIITDFSTLIIPMPVVRVLQVPMKRKLRIAGVFSGGILACAANVIRVVENYRIPEEDTTYKVEIIMLWAIAESALEVICGCLPILPILFRHRVKDLPTSSGRSSSYHRLRTFGPSPGAFGVQSAISNQEQGQEARPKSDTTAVHEVDLGSNTVSGNHSTTCRGVTDRAHKNGSTWQGDGILKTVAVEQTGSKVPESALIAPQGTQHTGSRSAPYINAHEMVC